MRTLFSIVSATALSFLRWPRGGCSRPRLDPTFDDKLDERQVVEVGEASFARSSDLSRMVLNVLPSTHGRPWDQEALIEVDADVADVPPRLLVEMVGLGLRDGENR